MRSHSRVRSVLVVAELALALVLLTGSGLMMRSFSRLLAVEPGFEPDQVLTSRLVLGDRYLQGNQSTEFFDRLQQRLEGLPQVESVGLVDRLPLHWTYSGPIAIEESENLEHKELELGPALCFG